LNSILPYSFLALEYVNKRHSISVTTFQYTLATTLLFTVVKAKIFTLYCGKLIEIDQTKIIYAGTLPFFQSYLLILVTLRKYRSWFIYLSQKCNLIKLIDSILSVWSKWKLLVWNRWINIEALFTKQWPLKKKNSRRSRFFFYYTHNSNIQSRSMPVYKKNRNVLETHLFNRLIEIINAFVWYHIVNKK
jgi:hypothetical protein